MKNMTEQELEVITSMLTDIQSKVRSSKNWDTDGFSANIVSNIGRIKTDIEWYNQERDISDMNLSADEQNRAFRELGMSGFASNRESNSGYDPGLPASEHNQSTY